MRFKERSNEERVTLLTIVFLFQLCYEIRLITARSSFSKPRHEADFSNQQNLSNDENEILPQVDRKSAGIDRQLWKHWLNLEKIPSPRHSVKLHSGVTLECKAVGSPPPVLYWTKNGKYLKASGHKSLSMNHDHLHGPILEQSERKPGSTPYGFASENKELSLGAVTSKLQLGCIRPEDEAEYSCVADNGGKKVMASTTLVIEDDASGEVTPECELRDFNFMSHGKEKRESSAYIMSWETFHMKQIRNNTVQYWTGNDGQDIVSDNKFYVSPSEDLLIKDTSWSEIGEYTCKVKNTFGSDVGSTLLFHPLLEEDVD